MWEVVFTDNSAWHSRGFVAIVSGYPTKEAAEEYQAKTRERQRPGQGSFVRKSPERKQTD